MEKGVTEAVRPRILEVRFSDQHLKRSTHYDGVLLMQVAYEGRIEQTRYPLTYDRFFKEGNGTAQEEYHDLHIGFADDAIYHTLLKAYPNHAVPIIIEKNIVRSPDDKKQLVVSDLETWLINALRSEQLSHRVRKGLKTCIQGL